MKLLYCEVCEDLVRPIAEPRFCMCGRHAIWLLDDRSFVRTFDKHGRGGIPDHPRAYIVLISNRLLKMAGPMRPRTSATLLAEGDPRSWFGISGSLVVRARPGEHPKTGWSDLPGELPRV